MDTELLIYFAFACKINLNIYPLLISYIFQHFLKGNTNIILSPVVVKSHNLEIQYNIANSVEYVPSDHRQWSIDQSVLVSTITGLCLAVHELENSQLLTKVHLRTIDGAKERSSNYQTVPPHSHVVGT